MKEEQGKKISPVVSDAAVKEVIPAKPTALSDEDLDNVAGGSLLPNSKENHLDNVAGGRNTKDVVKLN